MTVFDGVTYDIGEILGVFPVGVFEQRLIGAGKWFKIDHFDFILLDSPECTVHLEIGEMVKIML